METVFWAYTEAKSDNAATAARTFILCARSIAKKARRKKPRSRVYHCRTRRGKGGRGRREERRAEREAIMPERPRKAARYIVAEAGKTGVGGMSIAP